MRHSDTYKDLNLPLAKDENIRNIVKYISWLYDYEKRTITSQTIRSK